MDWCTKNGPVAATLAEWGVVCGVLRDVAADTLLTPEALLNRISRSQIEELLPVLLAEPLLLLSLPSAWALSLGPSLEGGVCTSECWEAVVWGVLLSLAFPLLSPLPWRELVLPPLLLPRLLPPFPPPPAPPLWFPPRPLLPWLLPLPPEVLRGPPDGFVGWWLEPLFRPAFFLPCDRPFGGPPDRGRARRALRRPLWRRKLALRDDVSIL